MKKIILSIVLLFALNQKANATQWMTSYEDAKKLAVATNKLILVDFWATWCGPCLRMDADAWSKPEVQELMKNFIPLKIDIDLERKVSSKYSIRSIPDVFIMDPNGEVIFHKKSYMDKNQVISLLKKYSYGTQLLQENLLSFMKKNTGDGALDIAEKYFDYSIYVNKEVKNDFLKLANKYLKLTNKLYKSEGNKNKNAQRIHLFGEVYKYLIKGDYEKTIENLKDDFPEDKIDPVNKGIYNFMYFTAYNKLKDKDNARIWYDKLKTNEGYMNLLIKSRKI